MVVKESKVTICLLITKNYMNDMYDFIYLFLLPGNSFMAWLMTS